MRRPLRGWTWDGARGLRARRATKVEALRTGAPAIVQSQVRTEVEATVSLEFESWGKLQMALAAGSQQMNLLATANGRGGERKRRRGGGGGSAGGRLHGHGA